MAGIPAVPSDGLCPALVGERPSEPGWERHPPLGAQLASPDRTMYAMHPHVGPQGMCPQDHVWDVTPCIEAAELGAAGLLLAAFSASVCSLLAITVDRYLSLYNALTYHSERTLGFTCGAVLLMWLLCLGVGLLPPLGWHCLRDQSACSVLRPVTKDNAAVLAVTFLLLFALMMQLYLQICKIAFRHAQQIAVQHQFIATAQATSTRKGLSTLSLILGTFALCWIPFAIYSLVADSSYPAVYTYSLALPAACNSLINPIIYAFRNPDIQKSLWLACCGCGPALSSRTRTSSDV
uniref:G-protein coupled receptors family 1 profile domain-containing protein n=1 Tax=Meleagris gallopavo TaxID=9103 RepID=A0A803Y698_MELGA